MNGQIEKISNPVSGGSGLTNSVFGDTTRDYSGINYLGLQYFGSMSASIAHEIKNTLAITNENAGLMEDLSLMVIRNGQSLDPQKMARLSQKVMDQVKRADEIVKKMSRFAHSVDDPVKVVSLTEVLELTLDLGRRAAASYSVTLGPVWCDSSISIQTNPFMLMNLFWLVVKSALKRVNNDKKIEIELSNSILKEDAKDRKTNVNISIINLLPPQLPCEQDKEQQNQIIELADLLNADVDMNNEDKIIITIITN